jgi:hypothetical protein
MTTEPLRTEHSNTRRGRPHDGAGDSTSDFSAEEPVHSAICMRIGIGPGRTTPGHDDPAEAAQALFDLPISCEVKPSNNVNQWRGVEAYATGHLEPRKGRLLQVLGTQIYCNQRIKPILASLNAEPNGYADHGRPFL